MTTQEILEAARGPKLPLPFRAGARDSALLGMADALCAPESMDAILAANAEEMAVEGRISDVMLDRLRAQHIEAMAKGIRDVAALPDPVGRVLSPSSVPMASLLRRPPCRWASSPSSTRAAPTSPATLPPSPSRAAMPASSAAAKRRGARPTPSLRPCGRVCGQTVCLKQQSASLRTPPVPRPTP